MKTAFSSSFSVSAFIVQNMKLLRELIFPLVAVLVAFIVGGIIVWLVGDNPFEVYGLLLGSALTWPDGIGYTLFYATPLIFTGLALTVAFRCGLLNIGAEGQLYVASFATAWVSIKLGGVESQAREEDRKSTRLNSSHDQ